MESRVSDDVVELLESRFGPLSLIGAGAWSTAYRFRRGSTDLVVRVGEHLSDFERDAEMSNYSSPLLPIPTVVELGQLDAPNDALYFCVSSFAAGHPLEQAKPAKWVDMVPAVAGLLNEMRTIKSPATEPNWAHTLMAPMDQNGRLRGWQSRLADRPLQQSAYYRSIDHLRALCASPAVARAELTLLHCDLINRNVHVKDGRITGVFDWGCRRWGDHLYDLAWFEFWSPWMTNLDIELLKAEMLVHWGEEPNPDRMAACLLHIGADHLVYNAFQGDAANGRALIRRLETLGLIER